MVADLTANDGKTTLLAYLVQIVKLKAPELCGVVMKGVQRAHSKANLPMLRPAVQALEQQVNDGLAEVTAAASACSVPTLSCRSAPSSPPSSPDSSPLCVRASLCLLARVCVPAPAAGSCCPDVELWGCLAVEPVQASRAVPTCT